MNSILRNPPSLETKVYKFYAGDMISYMDVVSNWVQEVDKGHLFERVGVSGPPEFYSHAELTKLFNLPRNPMGYLPRKKSAPTSTAIDPLSDLLPEEMAIVFFRTEYCKRFMRMQQLDKKLSTDDEFKRIALHTEMTVEALAKHLASGKNQSTFKPLPTFPTGRELRRWLKRWEEGQYSPTAFVRKKTSETGRREVFAPEVCQIIQDYLELYASHTRLEIYRVHEKMVKTVQDLNGARKKKAEENGEKPPKAYRIPCLDTFSARIQKMPRARISRGRDGDDIATKRYRAVNFGVDAVATMEFLQIDESRLDLRTILEVGRVYDTLTEEEKEIVARVRLWVTAVIDVASKCILALKIHHSAPSSASAIAALEMVTRDKSELAKALGCEGDWAECGNLGEVSTDSATWLTSDEVHAAIIDAGGDVFHPKAGDAPMRGAIERWFRTLNREALSGWGGRTWGSTEERGDADTSAKLCYDQASRLLYRYLIDVYHNTEHYALEFETPRQAWARLNKKHKPTPPLSPDLRRHAFGQKAKRKIHKTGIHFLGIRYSSEALQKLFRQADMTVDIRVDRYDLGAISVLHPQGWLTVPAVHREFAGMSVWKWWGFNTSLKLTNKENAAVPRSVALRTKAHLEQNGMISDAEAELGTGTLTDVQYTKWEKKLASRVDIIDDEDSDETDFDDVDDVDDIAQLLGELDDVEQTLAGLNAPTPKQKAVKKGKFKKDNADSGAAAPTGRDARSPSLLNSIFNS